MGFACERKITTKGVIEATYEDALKLVHNHSAMIRLNPLVVDHQPHPTEPDTHVITDKLKVLGFTKLQSYKAKVEKVDDGIIFHVDAGPVTSVNHWRLKRVAEDGRKVEVTEEANVKVRTTSYVERLLCMYDTDSYRLRSF
jgi:hypothetical protein